MKKAIAWQCCVKTPGPQWHEVSTTLREDRVKTLVIELNKLGRGQAENRSAHKTWDELDSRLELKSSESAQSVDNFFRRDHACPMAIYCHQLTSLLRLINCKLLQIW
jgi:hypothetical protein